jgi:dephospho-CoA kinase
MPLKEKAKLADYTIDNSGTLKETRRQVRSIWEKFQENI